jgi:hypothetical protein
MLASVELPQDFKLLNRQFQGLVQALLDEIEVPSVRVEVAPTQSGNFRGFDGSRFYIVESGTVTVRYANRSVYLLEEGDILLPDVTGNRDPDAAVLLRQRGRRQPERLQCAWSLCSGCLRARRRPSSGPASGDLLGHDAAPDGDADAGRRRHHPGLCGVRTRRESLLPRVSARSTCST